MKHKFQRKFIDQLESFPLEIRNKFQKQLIFLLQDIRHPSLHAKKYNENDDIWQARVDRNVRFYFKIDDDVYIIFRITKHPD